MRRVGALVSSLLFVLAVLPIEHAAGGEEAETLLSRARALEASVRRDPQRLRLRHNLEGVIAAWRRAGRGRSGAERLEALRGEARALALLAHWSGSKTDGEEAARVAAQVARAERELREARSYRPSNGPSSNEPSSNGPSTQTAPAPQRGRARLGGVRLLDDRERLILQVESEGDFRVGRHVLPLGRDQGSRVYFDLEPMAVAPHVPARISPSCCGVRSVRVAQFRPNTVRIVFDLEPDSPLAEGLEWNDGRVVARHGRDSSATASGEDATHREERGIGIAEAARRLRAALEEAIHGGEEDEAGTTGHHDGLGDAGRPASLSESTAAEDEEDMSGGSEMAEFLARIVEDVRRAYPEVVDEIRGTRRPPNPASSAAETLFERRLALPPPTPLVVRRVVIDAGHGGRDVGARGIQGRYEKDINLEIAKKLGRNLRQRGIDVVFTRTSDRFLSLKDRAEIANRSEADLFISVHTNAHRNPKIRGIETYYLNTNSSRYAQRLALRENSLETDSVEGLDPEEDAKADSKTDVASLPKGRMGRSVRLILADRDMRSASQASRRVAARIQGQLVAASRRHDPKARDLGVKHALFYVLLGARMPSVLVETGFITHPKEGRLLGTAAYQERIARAIAEGIVQFAPRDRRVARRTSSASRDGAALVEDGVKENRGRSHRPS